MRPLAELPHRFWPADSLPPGVEPPSKFSNMKAAAFKKLYGQVVTPRLRQAGFRCAGTKGARLGACLWEGTWFLTGKYGGTGCIFIAAHPPGFPARNHYELQGPPYDFPTCVFLRPLRFREGRGGDEFDLGRTQDEGLESATLMREAFETDGLAYLEVLSSALDQLLAITPANFEALMPALHQRLSLRVTDSSFEKVENSRPELALLLAQVHHQAGTAHTSGFCELGLAASESKFAGAKVPLRLFAALFTRLAKGEGPLHPTEDEKRAAWA